MKAPRRGLAGSSTLTTIVRRALARADLHPTLKGAYLLRHSLATSMLRSGGDGGGNRRSSSPSTPQHHGNLRQGGLRGPALTGSPLADWGWTVNPLGQALQDYLCIRRSLGFRLRLPASLLQRFVAFLQAEGADSLAPVLRRTSSKAAIL
jgi:hypothetical protein